MHDWSDKNVDWAGIGAAARYIGEGLKEAGVDVSCWKEKWGTVRVYCYLSGPGDVALYKSFYAEAVKKWPHLREEILNGADYDEYLTDLRSTDES